MTCSERHLRGGKRDYVVERYRDAAQDVGRPKELYLVQTSGANTVSTCVARFLLGHEATRKGKTEVVG
jgi:predicted ArsR family transcriptional regulator